jgi:hypothetical protein
MLHILVRKLKVIYKFIASNCMSLILSSHTTAYHTQTVPVTLGIKSAKELIYKILYFSLHRSIGYYFKAKGRIKIV